MSIDSVIVSESFKIPIYLLFKDFESNQFRHRQTVKHCAASYAICTPKEDDHIQSNQIQYSNGFLVSSLRIEFTFIRDAKNAYHEPRHSVKWKTIH